MIDYQSLLLSPKGRLGRGSFWTLIVAIVAASIVLSLVPFFGPLLSLLIVWPFACVTAKRLHDAGRSAWIVVAVALLSAASCALSFVATTMAVEPSGVVAAFALAGPALLLSGLSMVATLVLVLFAGLARGMPESNRFGSAEAKPITLSTFLSDDR